MLESLLAAATDSRVVWSSARRVVAVVSFAAPHSAGDSNLPAYSNDLSAIQVDTRGRFHDYPSLNLLKAALLAKNIVPVFFTSSSLQNTYKNIVSTLGFGYTFVTSATDLDMRVRDALNTIGNVAQAFPLTGGAPIPQPQEGYANVFFGAHLSFTVPISASSFPGNVDTLTYAIPGFGFTSIKKSGAPFFQFQSCPSTDLISELVDPRGAAISLLKSVPEGAQIVIVEPLPSGNLFQYRAGERGAEISAATSLIVTDPLGRVLYVPPPATGAVIQTNISYSLVDHCKFVASNLCPIKVRSSNFPRPIVTAPTQLSTVFGTSTPFVVSVTSPSSSQKTFILQQLPSSGILSAGSVIFTASKQSVPVPASGILNLNFLPTQLGNPAINFAAGFFSFTVSSPTENVESSQLSVSLFVAPGSTAPVPIATPRSIVVTSSVTPILLQGADPLGGPLTFTLQSLPLHGSLASCFSCSPISVVGTQLSGPVAFYTLKKVSINFFTNSLI